MTQPSKRRTTDTATLLTAVAALITALVGVAAFTLDRVDFSSSPSSATLSGKVVYLNTVNGICRGLEPRMEDVFARLEAAEDGSQRESMLRKQFIAMKSELETRLRAVRAPDGDEEVLRELYSLHRELTELWTSIYITNEGRSTPENDSLLEEYKVKRLKFRHLANAYGLTACSDMYAFVDP